MIIYHITDSHRWLDALEIGVYSPEGFQSEGFIHCSTKNQVTEVAKRYYQDVNDLILLYIDEDLVASHIKYENLDGGLELFPHIYGRLNIESVKRVTSFTADQNGNFPPPKDLF